VKRRIEKREFLAQNFLKVGMVVMLTGPSITMGED